MGIFSWFRKSKPSPIRAAGAAGHQKVIAVVDYSQPDKLTVSDEAEERDLTLHGKRRSLTLNSFEFAIMLILARKAGWRGGSDFFDEKPGRAFLYAFHPGQKITDSDATLLVRFLRTSADEESETTRLFIALCSDGGFSVQF